MKTIQAKRTKTVYKESQEIAHLWAHGLILAGETYRMRAFYSRMGESAGTHYPQGAFFANSRTCYSYGEHFPLACRIIGKRGRAFYLFNPGDYSKSTRQHQYETRRAIPDDAPTFTLAPECWESVEDGGGEDAAKWYQMGVDAAAHEMRTKKKVRPGTRLANLRTATAYIEEWRKLRTVAGLKAPAEAVRFPRTLRATAAEVKEWERVAKEDETKRKASAAKREETRIKNSAIRSEQRRLAWERHEDIERARAAAELAHVPKWRNGAGVRYTFTVDGIPGEMRGDMFTKHPRLRDMLRIDPKTPGVVETSRAARVPVEEARRLYDMLPKLCGRGSLQNVSVGPFAGVEVTPESVRVGCHTFTLDEVREFAAVVGWPELPELAAAPAAETA